MVFSMSSVSELETPSASPDPVRLSQVEPRRTPRPAKVLRVLQISGAERVQFAEQVIRLADDGLEIEAIYRGRKSRMQENETLRSILTGLSEEAGDYSKHEVRALPKKR